MSRRFGRWEAPIEIREWHQRLYTAGSPPARGEVDPSGARSRRGDREVPGADRGSSSRGGPPGPGLAEILGSSPTCLSDPYATAESVRSSISTHSDEGTTVP